MLKTPVITTTIFASILLVSCHDDDASSTQPIYKALELNIAHINDHHSNLDPFKDFEVSIDGVPTQTEVGGFARVTAAFNAVASTKNLLKLHAGDAITGTSYYTLNKGKADADMMNTVCFDAFTLGNHEFDDGDASLKNFIDMLWSGSCKTPVISANVQPKSGTPLNNGKAYISPYTIKEYEGIKIAVIGLTIAGKTSNSSRPLSTTQFNNEVTSAQNAIDTLKKQGIRHFVLSTHYGYDNDIKMASKLTDVDVIIGGDSHTLLGDFSALGNGITTSGTYPTLVKNSQGDTVCIGQAFEYSKAFGMMTIQFNEQGAIKSCQGQASLLMGDSFKQKDSAGVWTDVSDTQKNSIINTLSKLNNVKVIQPDAKALEVLSSYKAEVDKQKTTVIGQANNPFCLVRIPGESTNRNAGVAGCENANTLAKGSDAAQLVAKAFRYASPLSDAAIQNAGGVRTPISKGNITMNTAFDVLPFSNTLVELSLTGAEIKQSLEDAVSNHLDNKQSSGSHPYADGLRWNLDLTQANGKRIQDLQIKSKTTSQWQNIELTRQYTIVTNDFIASGKDGYITFGKAWNEKRAINTYNLYTQSLVDYILANPKLNTISRTDYAHQKVITADGTVLP